MIDEEVETEYTVAAGSLAEAYMRGQAAMDRLYDGERLRAAVEAVLRQLPTGPVTLVSTSVHGAGLAAACAALRPDHTCWHLAHAGLPSSVATGGRIVILEPLDAGAAWRDAMLRRFPRAELVFADPQPVSVPLAA